MTDTDRSLPPTSDEIERLFRNPAVRIARPLILGGIGSLRIVRRFGWDGYGTQKLLGLEQPLVFASNHNSHADTTAILGTLPRSIRNRTAVAAALDVFGSSSNGHQRSLKKQCLKFVVAAGFHAFAFDRHGPPLRSLRTTTQLLNDHWNLLLYPEGTRSRDGKLGRFKAGVGVLARFTGRPVIPVHVSGGQRVLPCGGFLPQPGRITVRYGDPLYLKNREPVQAFTDRLRQVVETLANLSLHEKHTPARDNGSVKRLATLEMDSQQR